MSEKLSKRTKIVLILLFAAVVLVLAAAFFWFADRILFSENPRFVIREIQLDCDTGYWAGKTEEDRLKKAQEFAKEADIAYGEDREVNTFTLNLREMRARLLRNQPEIKTLNIRRILPDVLFFEIRSRIPRADTGNGYYIDDDGVVLSANYYTLPKDTLPIINKVPGTLKNLKRGERIDSASLLDALKFIRMVDTSEDVKVNRIGLKQLISLDNQGKKYIQCEIQYPVNGPHKQEFRIQLPSTFTDVELKDIFSRLIPALDDGLRRRGSGVINLQYHGPAFSPQP